ncbi:MAG: DUF1552 domain-containing protein [Verrucomicrobia bacterium]|nr:DUF1552 domain-containing protein [Verrucomicrobiota bacterium]
MNSRVSSVSSPQLDRRRFLRNVGLGLALPALESFSSRLLAAAAPTAAAAPVATTATGAPLRTAFLYFPNGAIPAAFWPAETGANFALNKTMEPLANVKQHLSVLGGLSDLSANGGPDGGGDHARANGTFLTGVRIKKTNGADFRAGVSADQIMAQRIGLLTPFRSLELSCDTVLNVGTCDTDYACVYQHNLAWSSATTPLTPEVNPRALFERMFGAGTPKERAENLLIRQQQKRSVLDFIQRDLRSLTGEVSGRDREKIDEYFSSVRDIELRIQAAEQARSKRPQPNVDAPDAGIPASYAEYIRLMFDLLHLAFETDNTRVATFMIAGDGNNRDFAEIGVNDGHHNLSHHGGKQDWIEKVQKIDHFYVTQLAYFLEKMERTKDVDGHSLLHNSQIVYGSGNSDGNRHSHVNLPIILAGRAGGTLHPGRYTKFKDEPVTNLFLSMMDRIGGAQKLERFGDSTGRLANI